MDGINTTVCRAPTASIVARYKTMPCDADLPFPLCRDGQCQGQAGQQQHLLGWRPDGIFVQEQLERILQKVEISVFIQLPD